jgi:phosphoribosylformylglycinamidine synthase subunit PurL
VIGRVTDTGRVRVSFKGQPVADVPAHALVDDAPRYSRPSARPAWQDALAHLDKAAIKDISDGTKALEALSTSLNLCSREEVYTEYDHMVRSNTVVRPGSDAAVIRLKGTRFALALTVDCNARYCYLDPAEGARLAVAEAARNLACAGALPIGTTDCLNFGNPEKPEVMWQFERAIEGIADACRVLESPIVGGNVSFYNETEGKGIYPTPTIAMVGFMEDVKGALTQWFRKEGDLVFLLGDAAGSLGGSEYLALVHGLETGRPQPVDLAREKALHDVVRAARDAGLVVSAHDCSEGGLAFTLLECCITGPGAAVGAEIELEGQGRLDELLFGEAPTRIVVSAPAEARARLEKMALTSSVPIRLLGRVTGPRLTITAGGDRVVDLEVAPARAAWRAALADQLKR